MFSFVIALFGCTHRHYTFPRMVRREGADSNTYVVCLDCGKKFPYDWQEMKIVASAKTRQPAVA
jgi:hypothetical protein